MTSSQQKNIVQIPWFPKTEPPLAGGAQAGEWQEQDQASLGTIAKSLVYEVASTRVNSLPSPWSRALQFEQAVLNPKYPTRDSLLEELFGGLACLGRGICSACAWTRKGFRFRCQREDDAVDHSHGARRSLPDSKTALSRDPCRNP